MKIATIKQKIVNFCRKHAFGLALATDVAILVGAGYCGVSLYKHEKARQKEAMDEALKQLAEDIQKQAEELEAKKNNPDNQLTGGGWVAFDNLGDPDAYYHDLGANDIPLPSLGQFGQDILDRARNGGVIEDPESSLVSILVTVQIPEEDVKESEDSSQEKQPA